MCLLRAFKTGQSSKLFLVEIPQVMDLYEMKWILLLLLLPLPVVHNGGFEKKIMEIGAICQVFFVRFLNDAVDVACSVK